VEDDEVGVVEQVRVGVEREWRAVSGSESPGERQFSRENLEIY
jgi:hypothetical protein